MNKLEIQLDNHSVAQSAALPPSLELCAPGAVMPAAIAPAGEQSDSFLKRAFSFPAMLGAMLVGAVFVAGRIFQVDPDLWWHIRTGQNILDTLHWPTVDSYSFTAAWTPWIAYEWLGEILIGAAARFGGLRGLDALLIILGSAITIALYVYATQRSGNSKAGFATAAILLVLADVSFTLRPQMLGYLFIILTLIALERFRRKKAWALWFLPPLFLIWVNTHGSFIIGLGIIVVYWAAGLRTFRFGEIEAQQWTPAERRRLEVVFLLCLAVLPITPYGTRLAVYPFDMAFSQPINVANVSEWQSMPFQIFVGKFFLALLLSVPVLQIVFRFKWRLEELALFVFGAAMACLHVRLLLLFVPFFTPILATILARWLPRYEREKDKYILNAVLMAGILAAMVHFFPSTKDLQGKIASTFPVKAVEYLRAHPVPGPMFNAYNFGGYLIRALPEQRVFIDGRGDLYERGGVLSDYLNVNNLRPAAFAVLRAYGVRSCLLDRDGTLATALGSHPDWRKEYSDDVSVLFVARERGAPSYATNRSATAVQK